MIPTPDAVSLTNIFSLFPDEDAARNYIEAVRWPSGPVCPHCGCTEREKVARLKPDAEKKIRKGLLFCVACRKQFTCTVGTIFEDSHIPLNKWLLAFYLISSSKTGISALAIQRHLELGSYRTAWFLCHRVRHALQNSDKSPLAGIIEADETYFGHKGRGSRRGKAVKKSTVLALVQRGGSARAVVKPAPKANARDIRRFVMKNVDPKRTVLHSDESKLYVTPGRMMVKHETVNHSIEEYARGDVTTNGVEGLFANFKTSIVGIFHGVGHDYLPKYLDSYLWTFNNRKKSDGAKMLDAIQRTEGKRLTLEAPKRDVKR
ncbi:MAG: IS1595 family transposase [Planctomycetota bacterium]